jgi:uncharacterized membrane protein
MKNDTRFPLKKAIVSSIIILLVSLMVLALLYTIVNNSADGKYLWVVFVVWGGSTLIGLIAYWIYQIRKYHEKK